jgi:ABC transporter, substrate-binding protein
MRKSVALVLALAAAAVLTACGPDTAAPGTGTTYTYKDQTITVKAAPQRIVPLTTPLLNLSFAVGGHPVARPTTKNPIPDEARSLPELGQTQHIDMEKLASLTPDLVLGETTQNQRLKSLLESSQIPYLFVTYGGIDDNVPLMKFLGEIYGTQDQAAAAIADYEAKMKAVTEKSAQYPPVRIAILRATGKDVTAETSSSICAAMAEALHMTNVVTAHKELNVSGKTVPYSLEQLAADDPDIIFIVTMGNRDAISDKLNEEMRNNPAWSQVKAVRENRVHFLPQDLFLLNPGIRTPEAMEELLELAHPES